MATIFNNIITKMVDKKKIYRNQNYMQLTTASKILNDTQLK